MKQLLYFSLNLFFLVHYTVSVGQNSLENKTIQELDSLGILKKAPSYGGTYYTPEIWHKILNESKKASFLKGELRSYATLSFDYSYDRKIKSMDSTLYYLHRFENRIATLSTTQTKDSIIRNEIGNYYLYKGKILFDIYSFDEPALASYFEAYPYLNKNDIDQQTQYDLGLGGIYYVKKQYDKALELVLPRLKDTLKMDTFVKLDLLESISQCYTKKKMYKKSIEYSNTILNVLEEFEWCEPGQWRVKDDIAFNYANLGAYDKAIDLALQARAYFIKNNTNTASNSFSLGNIYYKMGDNDNALKYFEYIYHETLLDQGASLDFFFLEICDKLNELYVKKKDYVKALAVSNLKNKLKEEDRNSEKKAFANYVEINKKYLKGEQENQRLRQKNEEQKLYIIVTTILLVSILSLLGIVYYFKKYKKSAKEIQILKKSEKDLLEEQIRLRDNELDATAIALSERVDILNTIKRELENIEENNPKIAAVNKTINNLIKSSSDIAVITDKIESQYPKLTSNLKDKYPSLSDTEIRYCLLTKLNLTVKETSTILGVAPDTVKTSRSRLKKKMNVPQELSLKDFLDKIDA